jgi:hypothetical protein
MATMAQVNAARLAQKRLSDRAKSAVRALWGDVQGSPPETVRNAFLDAMPQIVDTYGAASAEVAAEYFEELTGFVAEPADSLDRSQIDGAVRYQAGKLWTGEQAGFVTGLMTDVDRLVKAFGRDTIYSNGDRRGVRYARIPSGSKTCAFCMVLASRDAVYLSRKSAGGDGNSYHGDCDCTVTPVRDAGDLPEGYDSEELYAVYLDARSEAGSGDLKDIVATARRQNPDMFTDGVH